MPEIDFAGNFLGAVDGRGNQGPIDQFGRITNLGHGM
jgi:hypothetical protein